MVGWTNFFRLEFALCYPPLTLGSALARWAFAFVAFFRVNGKSAGTGCEFRLLGICVGVGFRLPLSHWFKDEDEIYHEVAF